jgi:hypothetical protein
LSKDLTASIDSDPYASVIADLSAIIGQARSKAYSDADSLMSEAYWDVGRQISEAIGEDEQSERGQQLLKCLSEGLTPDFGKRYGENGLRCIQQIYLSTPDPSAALAMLKPGQGMLDLAGASDEKPSLAKQIEYYLLGIERGFALAEQQKEIRVGGQTCCVDLEFYNYILKSFVLVNLKTEPLTDQDLGMMSMCLSFYTQTMMTKCISQNSIKAPKNSWRMLQRRNFSSPGINFGICSEGDSLPIGMLLCADKTKPEVKYILPEENAQAFTVNYREYLPPEEKLLHVIEAWQSSNGQFCVCM